MFIRSVVFLLAVISFAHADINQPQTIEKALTFKSDEDWSNDDLKSLVMSGKKGIIYSWSPKYVYSVLEMPRFEKLAKKLGYEFIAVVDPRVSREEVVSALDMMNKKNLLGQKRNLASSGFFRNVSMDLHTREEFNHFPVIFIYNNKKIHERSITGALSNNEFQKLAKNFTRELK